MREKPKILRRSPLMPRITPASAGKTSCNFNGYIFIRDHPRECGKNSFPEPPKLKDTGSPPRVREKPKSSICCCRSSGITPASAGKTSFRLLKSWHLRDHPRECGKNHFLGFCLPWTTGSPPRVREKQVQFFRV